MVKSVLGVYHQGLRDWVIQRISAIYMAVFSLALIAYFFCHPSLSFAEWHGVFRHIGIKVATMLFLLSILLHAWIGIWTIFTDYIKSSLLRSILDFFVVLGLVACFFWGVLILWSV